MVLFVDSTIHDNLSRMSRNASSSIEIKNGTEGTPIDVTSEETIEEAKGMTKSRRTKPRVLLVQSYAV